MGTMHFLSSPLILGCYRGIYIHLLSLSKVDVQTSLFCKIAKSVAIFLEMAKSGWHDCHIVGKDKVFTGFHEDCLKLFHASASR